MTPDELIADRRDNWERLQHLVERARRSPRSLAGVEAQSLIQLYREATADLARLRAMQAAPEQVRRVNRLVTIAHGQLYGRRPRSRGSVLTFLLCEYPRLVRERWRYVATSLAISVTFYCMGYYSVAANPSVVADLLGGAEGEFRGDKTGEDFLARFQSEHSSVISSSVTTNNILVAFTAYALGITFGIGTVYVLIVNGAMLGGFASAYAQDGAGGAFWQTVLVHGGLELSAIVIAGGAGLIMGYALWCPGRRSRLQALREEARVAAKIALGLVPAFIMAGFLEGFITPDENIPAAIKLALGIATMLVYWLYLFVSGRETTPQADAATHATGGSALRNQKLPLRLSER